MNELQDFIIKDGVLQSYRGNSSEIIIPEGVYIIDGLAFINSDRKSELQVFNFQNL